MVRKKINVVVLMGGKSPEYNVSIASGIQVVKNLSKRKYDVSPVVISPDGKQWYLTSTTPILSLPNPLDPLVLPDDLIPAIRKNISGISQVTTPIDVVFIAMHGPFGEDGTIQGMLETAGIKYTGANVLSSAIGMDKLIFRQLMKQNKILIPKYLTLKKSDKLGSVARFLGKPPYFVKPNNQGSSVGTSIVLIRKDLIKALKLAWKYSEIALVDQYLKGREVTVAILGSKKPKALPIIEIVSPHDFFDYESKYQDERTHEIIPANFNKTQTKNIQNKALEVYKALDCRGVARVDMIIKGKKIFVLEINTIPYLGEGSLFANSAKYSGISFNKLLDIMIKQAI